MWRHENLRQQNSNSFSMMFVSISDYETLEYVNLLEVLQLGQFSGACKTDFKAWTSCFLLCPDKEAEKLAGKNRVSKNGGFIEV